MRTAPTRCVVSLVILVQLGSVGCLPARPPETLSSVGVDHDPATAVVTPPTRRTPLPALLVLSKRDETLAIVDPATLEVVARIPVGHDPHEVVASPQDMLAYVSNYGHGAYHTLAVVDLAARSAKPAIDLGALRGPHGLAYVGGKVWFTAEGAKVVGAYDPSMARVDLVLGTGQDRTHMLVVAGDMSSVITSNVSSGTLSFFEHPSSKATGASPAAAQEVPSGDGAPNDPGAPPQPPEPREGAWRQTLVPVGTGTEGFDVSPDGQMAWAANARDGRIAIVDVASKRVVQRLATDARGANLLKFSPDGKWALVSTLAGPDLLVFDAATRAEIKRVPLGRGAAGIVIQPDSKRAYVACTPDGYVAVVDLASMTVVGKIQAGAEPDGLAWVAGP